MLVFLYCSLHIGLAITLALWVHGIKGPSEREEMFFSHLREKGHLNNCLEMAQNLKLCHRIYNLYIIHFTVFASHLTVVWHKKFTVWFYSISVSRSQLFDIMTTNVWS